MIGKTKKHKGKSDCCNTGTPSAPHTGDTPATGTASADFPLINFVVYLDHYRGVYGDNIALFLGEKDYDSYELYNHLGVLLAIISVDEFPVYGDNSEFYQGDLPFHFNGYKWEQPSWYVPQKGHFQAPFYMRGVKKNGGVSGLMAEISRPAPLPPGWGDYGGNDGGGYGGGYGGYDVGYGGDYGGY